MILAFKTADVPLFIGISDSDRRLSVAAPITNYVFVLVSDLGQFKEMDAVELSALNDTKRIIRKKKSLSSVKSYVVFEMKRIGLEFLNEITHEEYLDFYKKGGDVE